VRLKTKRARFKAVWNKLESRFTYENAFDFDVYCGGLFGICMSVEMNGFDRATRGLNGKSKRMVRQAMRLARFAHSKGAWPL
jgi:hypothetical protein